MRRLKTRKWVVNARRIIISEVDVIVLYISLYWRLPEDGDL
jgi:hypothetical protein